MTTKKFELTNEMTTYSGKTLHRIRALRTFYVGGEKILIRKGMLGGWVEKESNLAQEGNAWILAGTGSNHRHGIVCDDACVSGNSLIFESAVISGNAEVSGNVFVYPFASVADHAAVTGSVYIEFNAHIYGNAFICGSEEADRPICWIGESANIGGNAHIESSMILAGMHVNGNTYIVENSNLNKDRCIPFYPYYAETFINQ